jgi:hypothetical protein
MCTYITQLEDFVDPKNAGKICKHQKSIYELKKESRSWNPCFDELVKSFGFIKNVEEPCVDKKVSGNTVVFLVLYVDDIFLIGNDVPMLEVVKSSFRKSLSMKDLEDATYILGLEICTDRSKRLIGLCQDAYVDKILNRFNMQHSKKGFLPMSHGITLSNSQCPSTPNEQEGRMIAIPYASAIGSIMYVMLCTRPDVSYALSVTRKNQSDYCEAHCIVV